MERGNQPSNTPGSSAPGAGTTTDPGATGAAGGGPSTVGGTGETEVSWDDIDFDQVEYGEDGSLRAPFVDDDGKIVGWAEATVTEGNSGTLGPDDFHMQDAPGGTIVRRGDGTWSFDPHPGGGAGSGNGGE